jgi:retinol dehydrogenase-14
MTFALNHLSYFAATLLSLEALTKSSSPIVINVSSSHYRAGRMNFDDLQYERGYDMNKAYCQSKLANQLFTFELSRRLQGQRIGIAAVHPGAVESGFGDPLRGFWRFMWRASKPLRRPPEQAGKEIVELLESPTIHGNPGGYYFKGRLKETLPHARDPSAARRLWDQSLELAELSEISL